MTNEIKVGSLWLEKDTNAIIKVLNICGDAAFIQVNDDPNGIAFYLDRITKNCTPYAPPRRCEGWVNVYEAGGRLYFAENVYPIEAEALVETGLNVFTTIKIEYEEPQS